MPKMQRLLDAIHEELKPLPEDNVEAFNFDAWLEMHPGSRERLAAGLEAHSFYQQDPEGALEVIRAYLSEDSLEDLRSAYVELQGKPTAIPDDPVGELWRNLSERNRLRVLRQVFQDVHEQVDRVMRRRED